MGWRGQPGGGKIDIRDWVVPDEAIIGQRPGILANGARVPAKDLDYSAHYSGNVTVRGIALAGTTMWIYVDSQARGFNITTKARDDSKDFDVGGRINIATDGTTLYVLGYGGSRRRVSWLAYTIATKARDNSKEGEQPGGEPSHFFTDGTTMWIGGESAGAEFSAETLPDTADASKNFRIAGFRVVTRLTGADTAAYRNAKIYGTTLIGNYIYALVGSHIYPQQAPLHVVAFKKGHLKESA